MDWIKLYVNLPDHVKMTLLAQELGYKTNRPVLALYVRLLCWCGRVCSDGDITGYGYREIAEACGVYRRYKRLYNALTLVGLIDEHEDGSVYVHGWKERQSDYRRDPNRETNAERRLRMNRERQRRHYYRNKERAESMAALVGSEPGAAADAAYESGAAGVNIEATSDGALRAARRGSGIDVHALETAYNSDYGIPYSEQNSTFFVCENGLGKKRKNSQKPNAYIEGEGEGERNPRLDRDARVSDTDRIVDTRIGRAPADRGSDVPGSPGQSRPCGLNRTPSKSIKSMSTAAASAQANLTTRECEEAGAILSELTSAEACDTLWTSVQEEVHASGKNKGRLGGVNGVGTKTSKNTKFRKRWK